MYEFRKIIFKNDEKILFFFRFSDRISKIKYIIWQILIDIFYPFS